MARRRNSPFPSATKSAVHPRLMPPTKLHRPAIWECMLGTVYALNDKRECKYFDYDHEAALQFAGVSEDRDPRLHKLRRQDNYNWIKKGSYHDNPSVGKLVLWIKQEKM